MMHVVEEAPDVILNLGVWNFLQCTDTILLISASRIQRASFGKAVGHHHSAVLLIKVSCKSSVLLDEI